MQTNQKKKRPGRPAKSAAERYQWAMICNKIATAAGLTQDRAAEKLATTIRELRKRNTPAPKSKADPDPPDADPVTTRQWNHYLGAKRCPKTLQDGAEIITAAESLGWYSPKPADWMRQEQAGEPIDANCQDITPADQIAYLNKKNARQQAYETAQAAIKELRTLDTYPPEVLADALPERRAKAKGAKLPPASYAEIHSILESIWSKLDEEEGFRVAAGG